MSDAGSKQSLIGMTAADILALFSRGDRTAFQEISDTKGVYYVSHDQTLDGLFLVSPLGTKEFAMLVATSRPGSLDEFTDTLVAIGTSLRIPTVSVPVLPTELKATYREQGMRFNYPKGWIIKRDKDNVVTIVNERQIFALKNFDELVKGQVIIFIYPNLKTVNYPFPEQNNPGTVAEYFDAMGLANKLEIGIPVRTLIVDGHELA